MTDIISLALGNLLAPMTLFFVLGLAAGLAKSDLQIPEQIGKGMSVYLMLSIGFKGGAAIAEGGGGDMLGVMAAGVLLSFLMPVLGFALLRATTTVDRVTGAAVAAHYGSVSVVTFVTAVGFLGSQNVPYDNTMVAVMALMETPAIVTGLLLARGRGGLAGPADLPAHVGRHLAREILLNGSVVVLVGAFLIGWATGKPGYERIAPFIVDPFAGVLCLFLLDMGLVAARQLGGARVLRPGLLLFGLYMPLIGATLGLGTSLLLDLDVGSATLLATLAASASYIAVPAAMRMALPQANAAVYLTLALAITFPFNVLIGIPVYFAAARLLDLP